MQQKETVGKPGSTQTFNTGETAESLRRDYNPDGSVLRRAQLRLLDMALYLQQTARQIGVPCRIDGGNVLGALRHGGFIPWDDDMDFVVEHKDFNRLCSYLKQHPHPQYVLHDHDTDPQYYKEWAMLRDLGSTTQSRYAPDSGEYRMHEAQRYNGLHIDIFPYEADMIPWLQRLAGKLSVNVNLRMAGRYPILAGAAYRLLHYAVFPMFRLIGRLFGNHDLYMHSYGAWFYEQNPRRAMVPHREIMFEGHLFEGPADPDEICRIAYGDYMQLPPKDSRDRHQLDITFID